MTAGETAGLATDAAETLRRVEDVRAGTRRAMDAAWFPLLLWGVIVLASAPAVLAGGAAIALYWVLAAPIGIVATMRFFCRRGFEQGLEGRNPVLYVGLSVTIAAACFVLGWAGSDIVAAVGPMYAVALGMLVFAASSRIAQFALASVALIAAATAIVAADPEDPALIAAVVEGILLLAAGLATLIGARARDAGARDAIVPRTRAG